MRCLYCLTVLKIEFIKSIERESLFYHLSGFFFHLLAFVHKNYYIFYFNITPSLKIIVGSNVRDGYCGTGGTVGIAIFRNV